MESYFDLHIWKQILLWKHSTALFFFFFFSVCYFQEYGSVVSFKFRKLFTSEKNLLFKTVVITLQVHLILSHFICIATLIRGTVNVLLKIKTWDRSFEDSFLYGLHIGWVVLFEVSFMHCWQILLKKSYCIMFFLYVFLLSTH